MYNESADISNIKLNEDILEIMHPKTDMPLGVRVGLRAIDDEALQKVKRLIRDARNKLQARSKNFTAKEEDENEKLLVFSAMTFWEWYIPELEPEKTIKGKLISEQKIIPANGDEPERIEPAVYEPDTIIPAVMGKRPTFHGEVPTFNQRRVYEVFDELFWFLDQLKEKCGETKSFFQ